jgi:diaminohydroxyphosphoribosylaminopyrimidine deaminase/5-amino-6-(5-phosphoribosylamino)uracil reductase
MNEPGADEKYMAMALDLAEKGRGRTSPNPMVGAVVVNGGQVVGQGWHKKAGTPHAEVLALNEAGKKAEGATLYVNLEPCCHKDKLTPPCSDAVIESKVARVVVGMVDPNPKVSGRGVQALRDAGIEVTVGVLGGRAGRLNEAFAKLITTGCPFVTMKVAQTLDGKIATSTGESKWITGPEARRLGHVVRDQVDAIVVGIGTVLRDDPSLTTRLDEAGEDIHDPHRIILDSHLRIPLDAKVLNTSSKANTYIATTIAASTHKMKEIKEKKGELLIVDEVEGRVSLPLLLEELARMGMTHVLIEGGARVNAEALRTGVVDKVMFFIAPKLLGGDDARGSIGGKSPESLNAAVPLTGVRYQKVGEDILIEGYIKKPGMEAEASAPLGEAGKPPETAPETTVEKRGHKRRRRHRR